MTAPARLTDRAALAQRRARTRPDALFLHEAAAGEVEERLKDVNRRFTRAAIVTGHPGFWRGRFPEAWVAEDAPVLDLEPGAHDLVVHAMALHWADDPVGQMVQCRRALRPDGLFLSVHPGGASLYELRAALGEAEIAETGGLSPRVVPMTEIRDMGALLQRAGFALPVADVAPLMASYADAMALMRDLRAMGEGNALVGRLRRPTRAAVLVRAAEIYAASYPADGTPERVRATFELHILTGWAPAESQPKPLRPGSARTRLADALGTTETPLGGTEGRGRLD